ncbi:MAG: CHASE3 domain-containing protein [Candidatus Obscuribacterales bacterium]|nr:CHASE3 domain-containing protein [Candidatus Obscuribacterales bacterium]
MADLYPRNCQAVLAVSANRYNLGMQRKFGIAQKGLILVSIPLIFELLFIWLIGTVVADTQQQLDQINHSRQALARYDELSMSMLRASLLAFLYGGSGDERIKERYQKSIDKLLVNYRSLKEFVRDDPEQSERLSKIEPKLTYLCRLLPDAAQIRTDTNSFRKLFSDPKLRAMADDVVMVGRSWSDSVSNEKSTKVISLKTRNEYRFRLQAIIVGGLTASFLITFVLYLYFKKNIAARILRIKANATKIAAQEPLLPEIEGTDEIAELDRAFHKAAEHMERLEQNKKQLVLMITLQLQKPVVAVNGVVDKLMLSLSNKLETKMLSRLQMAKSNAQRLKSLIESLSKETSES